MINCPCFKRETQVNVLGCLSGLKAYIMRSCRDAT